MFEQVQQLIEQRLAAQLPDVSIAWDNVEFIPQVGTPFIRPTITQTETELTAGTVDAGNWREHGLITIQIFTSKNTGARANASLSDRVGDSLRGYYIDRLHVGGPRAVRVGQDGEWFQSNVMIPFYFDNCLQGV